MRRSRARAKQRGEPDQGTIHVRYEHVVNGLAVTDNGIGLLTEEMRKRLKRVGAEPSKRPRRAFFHRGVREVFIAMARVPSRASH